MDDAGTGQIGHEVGELAVEIVGHELVGAAMRKQGAVSVFGEREADAAQALLLLADEPAIYSERVELLQARQPDHRNPSRHTDVSEPKTDLSLGNSMDSVESGSAK
ncbi:hypothetical protein GCM10027569_16920 [Flindersiella endophytica]